MPVALAFGCWADIEANWWWLKGPSIVPLVELGMLTGAVLASLYAAINYLRTREIGWTG